jgi:nitrogenase molybdenum-iron protein alpha/beta subunit
MIPDEIQKERGRLIDSMVDVHHYMFGKKVAIFGDPDLEGVPLVRFGFPVYDRVGVYRYSIMGYNGSIYLLDQMTNAIRFRQSV